MDLMTSFQGFCQRNAFACGIACLLQAVVIIVLACILMAGKSEGLTAVPNNHTTGGNNPQWWGGASHAGDGGSIDTAHGPNSTAPSTANLSDPILPPGMVKEFTPGPVTPCSGSDPANQRAAVQEALALHMLGATDDQLLAINREWSTPPVGGLGPDV